MGFPKRYLCHLIAGGENSEIKKLGTANDNNFGTPTRTRFPVIITQRNRFPDKE